MPRSQPQPGPLAWASNSVDAQPRAATHGTPKAPSGAPANGGPTNGAPAATPQTLRREILLSLRRNGPASPDQLAVQLGVSRTGVLQQLRALESAALVARQTVRHGVGRPRHLYDVTPDAQELFPSNYDGLASGLLAAVNAIGGDSLLEEVFATRRRHMADRVRRRMADRLADDAPIADRARELAVIQDELGYLAAVEVDDAGAVRLVEHNCAIYHVAKGNSAACQAELDLFREVLGVQVVRDLHIAAGDRCCSYRLTGNEATD
jgi:predicted ArsR family transcriptional regulator